MTALLIALLTGLFGDTPETDPLICRFTPADDATPIELRVEDRKASAAAPGLYVVEIEVDKRLTLQGHAGAITTTPQRDVMIRGVVKSEIVYTLGVNEGGDAALNVLWLDTEGAVEQVTHTGQCRNVATHIDRWVPS